MNITKDVIQDMLPLYFSGECSSDTKLLIEEFLNANPEFAVRAKDLLRNPLPENIPGQVGKQDELRSLAKTRRMLKIRSYILGFAIFFSIAPFSFLYANNRFYWFMIEAPVSATIYGIIGIGFWVTYVILKSKISDL